MQSVSRRAWIVLTFSDDGAMRRTTITKFALLIGTTLVAWAADAQQRPLLIGQSAALTGSQTEFGRDMRDGALAGFEHLNRKGGVQGRKIELVTLDDAGNEAKAKENSASLIHEHKVLALIGIAAFVVLLFLHPWLFGARAY